MHLIRRVALGLLMSLFLGGVVVLLLEMTADDPEEDED